MKITKQQLKQIVKEELLKELTGEEAAMVPSPSGRVEFFASKIPDLLQSRGIDIEKIAMALAELSPWSPAHADAHARSHFEKAQTRVQPDEIVEALAELLATKDKERRT